MPVPFWSADHDWPYTVMGIVEAVEIDTVYYADGDPVTVEEVYRALVDHDGYPTTIQVKEEK